MFENEFDQEDYQEGKTESVGKCLLAHIRTHQLDGYGCEIPVEVVREVIGIEFPAVATKAVFDGLDLKELSATDYVRRKLIDEGKYFTKSGGVYRVALPSENRLFIDRYMRAGDEKYRKAKRLSETTPVTEQYRNDNIGARLMMKIESARRTVFGNVAA